MIVQICFLVCSYCIQKCRIFYRHEVDPEVVSRSIVICFIENIPTSLFYSFYLWKCPRRKAGAFSVCVNDGWCVWFWLGNCPTRSAGVIS